MIFSFSYPFSLSLPLSLFLHVYMPSRNIKKLINRFFIFIFYSIWRCAVSKRLYYFAIFVGFSFHLFFPNRKVPLYRLLSPNLLCLSHPPPPRLPFILSLFLKSISCFVIQKKIRMEIFQRKENEVHVHFSFFLFFPVL